MDGSIYVAINTDYATDVAISTCSIQALLIYICQIQFH